MEKGGTESRSHNAATESRSWHTTSGTQERCTIIAHALREGGRRHGWVTYLRPGKNMSRSVVNPFQLQNPARLQSVKDRGQKYMVLYIQSS